MPLRTFTNVPGITYDAEKTDVIFAEDMNFIGEELQKFAGLSVDLTDGATPALDASMSNYFRLSAGGNRTIAVPSNPTDGQKIIIEHYASGGARTLALNSGTGGFAFGSDITALTETASGKRDLIGCVYHTTLNKWLVVAYVKGY